MKSVAYILAKVVAGKAPSVLEATREYGIVTESHLIYGPYDLLLRLETGTPEELDEFIYGKLRKLEGIVETITCLCATCASNGES
ncbi:MAG: Lrp/AsnC ligand binding domain-containing protein [Candidatus Ranarchaeia archaeon]